MIANLAASPVRAATPDNDFREYIRVLCETNIEFVSVFENFLLCTDLFQGEVGATVTGRDGIVVLDGPNFGPAGNSVKNRFDQIHLGDQGSATVSAGIGDSGFGVFATDLSGEIERSASELENGFDSDQDGSAFGIDYSFSSLILGFVSGSIDNDILVADGGSRLQSESDSKMIYTTWAPTDSFSLDAYYGNVDSTIDIRRIIQVTAVNTISGVAAGSTESEQTLHGISFNYDRYFGAWSLGAFLGLDSIETETDGYQESGQRTDDPTLATGFELRYPEQRTESKTRSLGLRLSYGAEFGWGTLVPGLKLTSVRESEAKGRQVDIALRTAPDDVAPFSVATDDADSSYLLTNFGIVAAMNNGLQIFLDYEKHSNDRYLDGTATTIGVLYAF